MEKRICKSVLKSWQAFEPLSRFFFYHCEWEIYASEKQENNDAEKKAGKTRLVCSKYPFALVMFMWGNPIYPFGDYQILPIFHRENPIERAPLLTRTTTTKTEQKYSRIKKRAWICLSFHVYLFAMSTG